MFDVSTLQTKFEARTDQIARLTAHYFRSYRPEARDEAIQNTLGLCWLYFVRLNQADKADDEKCFMQMVGFAAKHSRLGRLPQGCGGRTSKCAMNYGRRHHRGVKLAEDVNLDLYVARQDSVPDIAAFRIDVPAFLETLSERNRGIATDLANGFGTAEVARRWSVSPAAISQSRERLRRKYEEFHERA